MSNDYAMFIIHLPNDFDKAVSHNPVTTRTIKATPSIQSTDTASVLLTSTFIPCSPSPSYPSIADKYHEHSQQISTKSVCVALKNYFSENNIGAVWVISDDKSTYQVTYYVEFGLASDRTLQDLVELGIGKRSDTRIFVLPTTYILEGEIINKIETISTLSLIDDSSYNIDSDINGPTSKDLTLTRKIRKYPNESNFKKSIRARLMVHQVVASIRAATTLSFDFIVLICLASMLAAFGLLENSSVIIVASMLVSPLMNPILGIVFGLSVREHSLWRRGCRNELIGLLICITCGFILGLFTTFSETKWGHSTSFPTSEMKSRGDVKRLWVGVLIALPSGAGVALSVLGGNTGSLVGVAISASLLPPAVNCGLLFAYSLLGVSFSSIAATSLNNTKEYNSNLNCTKYINNDYEPLYTCNLAKEAAILAGSSLLLTIVNIVCIIIMALFILRIKEVAPLHQPNKDITNFFHHDVKVARDYNKTIREDDLEANNSTRLTRKRSILTHPIVKRWKTFKSNTAHENQQHQGPGPSLSINNDDTESRRKLLRLKTFAKDYDLDVFDKNDYDLLNSNSRDKVRLLVSDLVDMYQEISPTFADLFHLQPSNTQTPTDKDHKAFYEEIIEILPPKWYQLFVPEKKRREIMPWSSSFNRTYSLHAPRTTANTKSFIESNENDPNQLLNESNQKNKRRHFQRRSSVPPTSAHSLSSYQDTEIPIKGSRFRMAKS